jgi:hypothetical protein
VSEALGAVRGKASQGSTKNKKSDGSIRSARSKASEGSTKSKASEGSIGGRGSRQKPGWAMFLITKLAGSLPRVRGGSAKGG